MFNEIPEVFNIPSDIPPQRWSDKTEYFKQNPLYPIYGDYIQDFPDPPVTNLEFNPPPQDDFNTTLDELENVISDIFLTIRGMRSK